jgi:DNA-binding transcriptional MerR regulator
MNTLKDLAKATGQRADHLSWAADHGFIPPPDLQGKTRRYYSPRQLERVVAVFKRPDQEVLLTKARICKAARVTQHYFDAMRDAGLVPPPATIKGQRELWGEEVIEQVREAFANFKAKPQPKRQEPEGYFSQSRAARVLGIPKITIQLWVKEQHIPRPAHRVAGWQWPFYNEADLQKIRAIKANYFKARAA